MTGLAYAPGNPTPELAETTVFEGPRGLNVRVMFAPAPSRFGKPRGTIFLCPGRTEYIEKYFEVCRELQAMGFAVLVFDWPGQGRSGRFLKDPTLGHVDRFETFVDAFRMGVDLFASRTPEPHVVLAHSMGGAISLEALRTGAVEADAAAFCAPMWGIQAPPFALLIARIMRAFGNGSKAVSKAGEEKFEGNPVTHDEGRWTRQADFLKRHPQLLVQSATWGWFVAARTVIARLTSPGALTAVKCPVLIASAGEEELADNASHTIVDGGLAKSTHITIDGAKHEILMETDDKRAQFWAAFNALLDRAGI